MRKIVPILCILALSLSGCSSTTLLRNGVDELRDYIASENAKTKKKLDDRLNKKISTLNRAISEKNEEIIFELMADDLREDGDKLKSQLKDFVNFIPGKIVETSNHSWGTLIHAENYKDAPDNVNAVDRHVRGPFSSWLLTDTKIPQHLSTMRENDELFKEK